MFLARDATVFESNGTSSLQKARAGPRFPGALHARSLGGVAERFNAPVLKTGGRKPTRVRIPPPPLHIGQRLTGR